MKRLIALLLLVPVALLAPVDQSQAQSQRAPYQYTFETDPFTFMGVSYPADGFTFSMPWPIVGELPDLTGFSYLGAPLTFGFNGNNGLDFGFLGPCARNVSPPHGSEFCSLEGEVTTLNVMQSIDFAIQFVGATSAGNGDVHVLGTAIVKGVPVPEPSTAALMAIGLVLAAAFRLDQATRAAGRRMRRWRERQQTVPAVPSSPPT